MGLLMIQEFVYDNYTHQAYRVIPWYEEVFWLIPLLIGMWIAYKQIKEK